MPPSSGAARRPSPAAAPSRSARSSRTSSRLVAVDATQVEQVFREESGKAIASLVRRFGDIDVAEEAVQEAFVIALQRWPSTGLPPSPIAWIITTARNRAVDRHRRESTRDERHAQAELLHADDEPEEVGP